MNVKKAAANILSYALVGAAAFWMVQALTSENDIAKAEDNVDTQGNVDIVLNEYQRGSDNQLMDFQQDKNIYPASCDGELAFDEDGYWTNVSGAVDKIAMVKNIGAKDTFYRTIIAVESTSNDVVKLNLNEEDFEWLEVVQDVEITGTEHYDGGKYDLYVGVYNTSLKKDDTPVSSLRQVMISPNASNEDVQEIGEELNILVYAQACEVHSELGNEPEKALDIAFKGEISETNHPWLETKQ